MSPLCPSHGGALIEDLQLKSLQNHNIGGFLALIHSMYIEYFFMADEVEAPYALNVLYVSTPTSPAMHGSLIQWVYNLWAETYRFVRSGPHFPVDGSLMLIVLGNASYIL